MFSLVLRKVEIVRFTRRRGYMVITPLIAAPGDAVAKGESISPIPFRRTASGWSHGFGGDGLLLRGFDVAPARLSWSITATLTNDAEQGKAISDTVRRAVVEAGGALVEGSGSAVVDGVAGVLGRLGEGLEDEVDTLVANTKVAGTIIGSKTSQLDRPFEVTSEEGKVRMELAWLVG